MQCITETGSGTFAVTIPQPTLITDCVYVVADPTELGYQLFSLTTEQGTELAIAIATLWAIGAVFRILISMLNTKERDSNETN